MLVTELGISTEVRLEHPRNALSPMLVTELGISTAVRLLQSSNAEFPMLVMDERFQRLEINVIVHIAP